MSLDFKQCDNYALTAEALMAPEYLPTSVAQVTSQRTISLLLQFRVDRVILITFKTHKHKMIVY